MSTENEVVDLLSGEVIYIHELPAPGRFTVYDIKQIFRTKEPDMKQLMIDVFKLIKLVLTKGPKALTFRNGNISAEDLSTINYFVDKYGIENYPKTTTTVTFSRVVVAFAPWAFKLLVEEPNLHRPVSTVAMEALGYPKFPTCLTGAFIFSMVYDRSVKRPVFAMMLAALHYMVEEAFVFARKQNPTEAEKAQQYNTNMSYARSRMRDDCNVTFFREDATMLINNNMPDEGTTETWINSFKKAFPNEDVLLDLGLTIL